MPIFDHAYPRSIIVSFSFPEFISEYNKSAQFIISFFRRSRFCSPMTQKATPFFEHANPLIIAKTFSFPKIVKTCKKLVYSINSYIQPIIQCCDQSCHTHSNIFQSAFDFHEFLSICKKSGFFIILLKRYT